ncbi:BON domain-containing protein [Candidatus Cyrtobacter comes]|uniref:BON domain-containing protein n=1 Tax=Candidatus Cyrtobacter comes TaxID=675776 RepID=UPI002ACEF6E7|nr:BON domain-containing protein [Candidatus Cyrtobacter comes]
MVIITLAISSCALTIAAGTGVTIAVLAYKDKRSAGSIVDDNIIYSKISALFMQKGFRNIFMKIRVLVVEGRVMLVGALKNEEQIKNVTKTVWSVDGVKEVINELITTDVVENSQKRAAELYKVSKIKSILLLSRGISSSNYAADVEGETAYIIGISENKVELQKVLDAISNISGISKVISHVVMKDDHRRLT